MIGALRKRMSKPKHGDMEFVKRLGRYLLSHAGTVCPLPWKQYLSEVTARSDSDWAGDRRDQTSVGGGKLVVGSI